MGRTHTSFYRRNVVLQTSFAIKISGDLAVREMEESIPVLVRASETPPWIQYGTVEGRMPSW